MGYHADQQEGWECRSTELLAVEGRKSGRHFQTAAELEGRVGTVVFGSPDEKEGYVAYTAPAVAEQDVAIDAD